MEINILEEWEAKGYRNIRIATPGAENQPIFRFRLEGSKKSIPKAVRKRGQQSIHCPIYPNHNTKADGSCSRSYMCDFHLKSCPATK